MQKLIIILLIVLQAATACAQSLTDKLDEYLTANTKLGKFNGTALVAKGGTILLQKGYGWRNAEQRVPHDENSIFQIGSVTKQFTATIILYLQEKGKLNVQDKLEKYMPGYPNGDKITLEHLLTHTSGVYNYTNDNAFMTTEAVKPASFDNLLKIFRDKPLDFEPGTKYRYSNSGYLLLGHIIQKLSGKPYEQMVRELIFKPLKMTNSGFDYKALQDPRKSIGYFMLDSDTLRSGIVDSSVAYSAGAIYTTAGDLYKWHKALYTNDVIKQASLEKAFTPYKSNYGYGWISYKIDNKRIITHGGGIFGFTSEMMRVPEDDVCIILLTNKPDELSATTNNLFNILYNKPYTVPKEREELKLSEEVLQQYVGEYEFVPGFKITITLEGGRLKAQATDQPKFDIFAQRENFFFTKVVDAQLEFIKGADGKVEKMILHQGGKHEAKKIK